MGSSALSRSFRAIVVSRCFPLPSFHAHAITVHDLFDGWAEGGGADNYRVDTGLGTTGGGLKRRRKMCPWWHAYASLLPASPNSCALLGPSLKLDIPLYHSVLYV